MAGNLPTRPDYDEDRWVDYDEDTACWGVFGIESGCCYALYASEQEAVDSILKLLAQEEILNG